MSALALRWRFFWSRRSRGRILTAILLAVLAALITAFLLLPATFQQTVTDTLTNGANALSTLGSTVLLASAAALLFLVCLAFIFAPGYRRRSYLATAPSLIPPISVYLDAENQLSEASIRPFTRFLMKHLDGQRADLLYFLDASLTAKGNKYKRLYRFGFRPVDVPQDPTGEGKVKEAVDKELAMHAYERALLGPPKQEFIIVTGDADFVPLVYRLAALGHRVQIWSSPVRQAYRTLATYLDVNVLDISQVVSEIAAESPTPLEHEDESEQVLRAISDTLKARETTAAKRRLSSMQKSASFRGTLAGPLAPRLAQVGYSVGNRLDYWIEHLTVLGILLPASSQKLPERGTAEIEHAASQLYAIAVEAAKAIEHLATTHPQHLIRMDEVADTVIAAHAEEDAASLLVTLLKTSGQKRTVHARYFSRCARALGLIHFDDDAISLDTIRYVPTPPAPAEAATE